MGDNLEVTGLEFDTRDFERAIQRAERRLDALENSVDQSGKAASRAETQFDGLGKKIIGLAAAYGVFRGLESTGRFIFNTNVEFQKLEATLGTVTGSIENGQAAFGLITDFAKTTPFEVANLTQAFIALRVRGFEPSKDELKGLGNFASAFVADITDLSDAVVSATAGMSKPLKRFGIDAAVEGKQISLTFQGVTRTVENTAENVSRFLAEMGNTKFADAMADRMKTLDGAISNLKDSSSLLAKQIGDAGVNGEITNLVRTLDDAINNGEEFAKTLGGAMAAGVRGVNEALELLIRHQQLIITGFEVLAGIAAGRGLAALVTRLLAARAAAAGLGAALVGLTGGPLAGVMMLAGAIGGPLVMKLLTARQESEKLVAAIQKVGEILPDVSGETLQQQMAGVDQALQQVEAKIGRFARAGRAAPAGSSLREHFGKEMGAALRERAALEQLRADIQAQMASRMTMEGLTVSVDRGGPDEKVQQAMAKITASLMEQKKRLEEGEEAAFRFSLAQEGITGKAQDQVVELWRTVEALEEQKKASEEARKAEERRIESIDRILEGLKEENLRLTQGAGAVTQYRLATLGASADTLTWAAAMEAANRTVERQQEAVRRLREEELAKLEAEFHQLKASADRMAESVTDAFLDVITGTESVGQAFSRMVDAIIRELARLAMRQAITEPLAQAIAGALSGQNAPRFPEGSAFNNGTGLEARPRNDFVPTLTGNLSPSQTSTGRAVVVNQSLHFNVTGMDGADVSRVLRQQKGQILQMVGEGVRESTSFRRMMGG